MSSSGLDVPWHSLQQAHGKLYVEVAALLRKRIFSGAFEVGSRIPSLELLAHEFGVAVVTVRSAVALLEQEGLLFRQQGRGTFVSERIANRDQLLMRLESNWESLLSRLDSTETSLLMTEPRADCPFLDSQDGVAPPGWRYMRRLHSSRGQAYAVLDIYIDRSLYARAPRRFETELVIPMLEQMSGVELVSAHQRLTIGTADLEEAALLGIPINSPVGQVRRVLQDQRGAIAYAGLATYRGSAVRLERRLTRVKDGTRKDEAGRPTQPYATTRSPQVARAQTAGAPARPRSRSRTN